MLHKKPTTGDGTDLIVGIMRTPNKCLIGGEAFFNLYNLTGLHKKVYGDFREVKIMQKNPHFLGWGILVYLTYIFLWSKCITCASALNKHFTYFFK